MDIIVKLLAADAVWDELNPQPQPSTLMAEFNDGTDQQAYLYTGADITDWPPSASIVGAWDRQTGLQEGQYYDVDGTTVLGTPTYPVTADYTDYVRPLGNDNGRATGLLDSLRWQGMPEPKFLQDAQRYKDTDAPFTLKITRVEHVSPDPFPGFGWVVEMLSDDPLRDITARAVGIYTDPECTAYLYTTGAFIQDGSHDNHYYTECPVGQRQPTNAQVNFALLLGSVQEGFFNLPEGSDESEALFWSKDQGGGGGVPEWSGAAVPYAIDDLVMYEGTEYVCIQAHTSQPAWNPPAVASLWAVV